MLWFGSVFTGFVDNISDFLLNAKATGYRAYRFNESEQ